MSGSSSRPLSLRHMVHSRGNNGVPIVRALEARAPVWSSEREGGAGGGGEDSKEVEGKEKVWTANCVWKPTWAKLKPPPPEYQRGSKDLRKRQIVNHLVAVEPLCTKDSLHSVMTRFYKVRGEIKNVGRGACVPLAVAVVATICSC